VIVSMAPSLRADCAPWASGTNCWSCGAHHRRRGRRQRTGEKNLADVRQRLEDKLPCRVGRLTMSPLRSRTDILRKRSQFRHASRRRQRDRESRNRSAYCDFENMPTFQTTNPKVAIRFRYNQHRGKQTTLTVEGSLITGLVHSVMEVKSSNPTRWITVVAKPRVAA
jgi:hypothetical protein